MKKLFCILSLCISILFTPKIGVAMDTSDWKTYAVGRYFIDLPPSAQFY